MDDPVDDALVRLRRELHAHPEVSNQERETAERVRAFLEPLAPARLLGGVGGHGVVAVFGGAAAKEGAVWYRCELDALPVEEDAGAEERPHRSTRPGVHHGCGHDGHMAILCGLAARAARAEAAGGLGRAVVLVFQPAEETGEGAARVLDDLARLEPPLPAPRRVFALHNAPELAAGTVHCRAGCFAKASRGATVTLRGLTAHASQPENGVSPAPAAARLVLELPGAAAAAGGMATVVHALVGEPRFGCAPGRAEVRATLRAETDVAMERVVAAAEALVARVVRETDARVEATVGYEDVFAATVNDAGCARAVAEAAGALGVFRELPEPFPWSEDFGLFARLAPVAMFSLGTGGAARLHNEDYDFSDDAIALGVRTFWALYEGGCNA